jgi:hypothetical protein
MDSPPNRLRPRLSRTFSRSRWSEYERFLGSARDHSYELIPLEQWVRGDSGSNGAESERVMIMRHDVDQHPRSALTMAGIESNLGIRSTWYFRWRTAHPAVVEELRERGFEIGLHYETLTRRALEGKRDEPVSERALAESRAELREEIAAFERIFGSIHSVVPHGDSRVPEVRNAELLRGEDCSAYGIEFDGNEAMRGRGIAYWLTDRTTAEGGWKDGADPEELLTAGASPILCLTHPNNWASGAALWLDRALRGVLPRGGDRTPPTAGRPIHTGSDQPPR